MNSSDLMQGFNVNPFSKLIWNNSELKKQWEPIVKSARNVHDKLEYEMVKQGHRKCATLHITPHVYDKVVEKIFLDNLLWLPIQRTQNYSGFSHTHFPVNQIDMNTSVYGVLARNKEDAESFREASTGRVDHIKIGELLGFPACCGSQFVDWWGEGFFDPVYQCSQVNPNLHVATHQMLRYAGFRLTSHFPCSFGCEESIRIGETWYKLGLEVDPKGMESLIKILTLPGKWSVNHGIATVELEPFTVVTNSLPTKSRWEVRWDEVKTY